MKLTKLAVIAIACLSLSGCIGLVAGGAASCLAGGCGTSGSWTPIAFDDAEYSSLKRSGNNTIRGQVFAKTRGGDVKKGAGNPVRLIPVTKYTEQWYTEQHMRGKRPTSPPDPRYASYDTEVVTDADGRFEFSDLPAGDYYVISNVTWETVSTNPYMQKLGLLDTQGGAMSKRVTLIDGKKSEVMLTR